MGPRCFHFSENNYLKATQEIRVLWPDMSTQGMHHPISCALSSALGNSFYILSEPLPSPQGIWSLRGFGKPDHIRGLRRLACSSRLSLFTWMTPLHQENVIKVLLLDAWTVCPLGSISAHVTSDWTEQPPTAHIHTILLVSTDHHTVTYLFPCDKNFQLPNGMWLTDRHAICYVARIYLCWKREVCPIWPLSPMSPTPTTQHLPLETTHLRSYLNPALVCWNV